MFGVILKGVGLASTPTGRRVIRNAAKFARSEEGRKLLAQARLAANTPEARRLAQRAAQTAKQVGVTAKSPENRDRMKAAAKYLRERPRRP